MFSYWLRYVGVPVFCCFNSKFLAYWVVQMCTYFIVSYYVFILCQSGTSWYQVVNSLFIFFTIIIIIIITAVILFYHHPFQPAHIQTIRNTFLCHYLWDRKTFRLKVGRPALSGERGGHAIRNWWWYHGGLRHMCSRDYPHQTYSKQVGGLFHKIFGAVIMAASYFLFNMALSLNRNNIKRVTIGWLVAMDHLESEKWVTTSFTCFTFKWPWI
jgi:hypothetical protein